MSCPMSGMSNAPKTVVMNLDKTQFCDLWNRKRRDIVVPYSWYRMLDEGDQLIIHEIDRCIDEKDVLSFRKMIARIWSMTFDPESNDHVIIGFKRISRRM